MSHTQPDIPAIYGRVSGERQAEAGTIESQIEDLRQRVRRTNFTSTRTFASSTMATVVAR